MPVNFTGSYTQNFDTLVNTGTSTTLPANWVISESGGQANTGYTADTGASNTGDTYSYGATGSTDRALGGLQSGNLTPLFGTSFTNTTGSPITALTVSYTGEQWRSGAAGRVDQLDFQYSVTATSLANGTWIDVNTLDFIAPITSGTGALDGNVSLNRTAKTATISGLNIPVGASFWFRWQDLNATGQDDGLAIDDFSLTNIPPVNLSVSSTDGTEAGTTVITVTVTAAAAVTGNQTVSLGVSGTGITTGDYSLSNSTITILSGQTTSTATFTVKDDFLIEGSETATLTLSTPSAGIVLGSTTMQNITIADNDFPVVTLAAGINPAEGSTQGTYTLTLNSPAPAGGLTINYTLTGSTATNPADYTLAVGSNITGVTGSSFTIAAGQTSATLLVNAVNDGIADPNETVKLTLAAGSGYTTGYNATTPFTAATPVTVGSGPYSVAIGDFNGDGKADFAVANNGSGTVSIRLGDGLGGFTGTTNVTVGSNPRSVAIGDFNGDGKADIAATNNGSNTVSIRLGDGLGGFTGTTNVAVGTNPISVAIGDFNGDGKADIAVTNNGSNTVSIRLGDGLGGFTGTTNVAVGTNPISVAIGDFNGDGKADIAATNGGSNTVSIRLGDGLGGFTGTTNVAVGTNPISVAIADFNGDGKLDFAAANSGSNSVSIRLGDGLGGFTGTTNVAVGSAARSVAIADFNGDGKLDFAAANGGSNSVSIRLGDGLGGFTGTTNVAVGTNPQSVAIADFNGDGKADIAAANLSSGNVSVLLNNAPSATLTIADAPTVNLSVNSTAGSEAGTTVITVTATASSAVSSAQTVSLGVSGTGITTGDYSLSNSTITIPNGATTGSVSFTVANDAIAEGTETAILTLSNPSTGIVLGGTTTQAISITDNDTAGITITQVGGTTVTEGGATDTYTVALTSQPTANVTVALNPGSQTSTNTNSLTFTSANWNVAQSITVTAIDDNIAEGPHIGTISHTASSADPNYNNITILPVTATITDNDTAGVSIIQSGGTAITEGGATDTYTVALTSQPTSDVVLTLNPGSQTSTNTNTLTFTSTNWNVAQSITVTAVDDNIAEGTHPGTISHTATSTDPNYNNITIVPVSATITDNDTAGVSIIQSGGNTTITEGGATDTYTVALTSQPTANVTVALNPGSQTSTNTNSLTFTAANWNVAQTVTVTAVNDLIAEGTHSGTITHTASSTDLNYNGIVIGSITAAITDNDTAGVSIIQSGGNTTITEGGATDTYTVALTSQPTANVTITLNPDSQTTTNTNSLTFTSANWNVAQTITVTTIDDNIADGTHTGTISHTAISTDPNYNNITIVPVTAAITDNDTAGVSIIQSGGNTTITEGGATDTYTVALTSQPTANVTITLNPGTQTSTNTNSLTFTSANWNVAQTITVTAVNDLIAEGLHPGTITHTATSTDPNYNNITIGSVTAAITDNDNAGVSIIQSGGTTTITEGGATDTYTIALTSQPTANVTITLNPGTQTSTNTNSLTFTAANWNTAQTITVTAVDDNVAEGTNPGIITHTATSTDANYNGIAINSVPVTITDNDTAGVTIIQSGGTTAITEGGATDTYTVALTSQPTANVTIALNPDSQTSTSASTLTFTSANWNVAQTITVTAVNDLIAEGLHPGTITHTATSTDPNYNNITIVPVTAVINDNDNAGVSIIQSGGTTTITEGGATDTYTVALTSQPTANVTITLNPGTQTSTNTNSLTFTSANWNVAQTITVTATDDNITEGPHTGTISHSASSTDPNYNGIAIGSVIAAITDNDNPPTDLTLSATSVNENVAPNTTIGTFSTLDLDGGSFTYSLVPGTGSTDNSAFSISGNQLRIINSPDFETQASYSVRVRTTDFSGLSYEEVVSIIVNNLNDAPILTDTVVALNSIRFNAPAPVGTVGTSISQLVDFTGGSGQNNVIDPDAGALTGIAITNVDSSNGTWFYSTNNGTNWSALGGVSDTNALLLADNANTRLYFRPTLGYTGTVTNAITYRAWDQTSGTNGATANTTSNGNPTAFSVQFDTASLQVNRSETTDFTQDGKPDILWRNSLDGSNCVWEMDGTTYKNTTNLIPIDPSSGWNAVAIGDFTQDGKPDILWRNSLDGSNCVWEMDGTTYKATTNLIPIDPQSGWEIVGTGDFTQDGKTDILWRNSLDGSNCVWEMDGTTYKATTNLLSVSASSGWKIAGVGDFTNDGNPDILWRNSVNGSVGIWGMNGTTYNSFTNVATISPSTGWNIV